MEVEKLDARQVFKDNNKGYTYGLQDTSQTPYYTEWFKTKREREQCIKKYKMKVK